MKRLVMIVTLVCVACGPIAPPTPPVPPPSNPVRLFHVTARLPDGNGAANAAVQLLLDNGPVVCRNDGGRAECSSDVTGGGYVSMTADGYVPIMRRIEDADGHDLAVEDVPDGEFGEYLLVAIHTDVGRVGVEHGWLRHDGSHLSDDGGAWRGVGLTSFRLLQRSCNGENIDPILDQAIDPVGDGSVLGANYLRVLGMYDPYIGHFNPAEYPGYDACLRDLLTKAAARKIRIKFDVFADAQRVMPSDSQQHAFLDHVNSVLNEYWNVIGSLGNEWPQNGFQPGAFTRPTGRVLWSRGSGLGDGEPFTPPWDIVDDHPGRNDEWPRKVECRPITDTYHVPCLEDEPVGASSVDKPGSRSSNADDFGYLGGLCSLWADGCLFHSDSAIQSELMGPIELVAYISFLKAIRFAPTDANRQPYQRGDPINCGNVDGNCDAIGLMPMAQLDLPNPRGILRLACRPFPGVEWCAGVRPGPLFAPFYRNGWLPAERSGPNGLLFRLTK